MREQEISHNKEGTRERGRKTNGRRDDKRRRQNRKGTATRKGEKREDKK